MQLTKWILRGLSAAMSMNKMTTRPFHALLRMYFAKTSRSYVALQHVWVTALQWNDGGPTFFTKFVVLGVVDAINTAKAICYRVFVDIEHLNGRTKEIGRLAFKVWRLNCTLCWRQGLPGIMVESRDSLVTCSFDFDRAFSPQSTIFVVDYSNGLLRRLVHKIYAKLTK